MKTSKLFSTLLFALLATGMQATIYNVNNDTPSPGEYTNLQVAIDAASAGDTIYLAPTLINYGDITLGKQLVIMGPGFQVGADILGAHAVVEDIDIADVAASGSGLHSFRFHTLTSSIAASAAIISNFSVKRCLIINQINSANDYFTGYIFEGNKFVATTASLTASVAGAYNSGTFSNNIINGIVYYIVNSEVSHNCFLGPSGGASFLLYSSTNNTLINNISIGRNVFATGATNTYAGNISFDGSNNTFPNGTNLENVDPLFTSAASGYFAWTNDYTLAGGSPGIGTGAGGADIGLYGGDGVYRKDGEPSIPIIRSANVPGGNTVPANSTFNVNIISEAHE